MDIQSKREQFQFDVMAAMQRVLRNAQGNVNSDGITDGIPSSTPP